MNLANYPVIGIFKKRLKESFLKEVSHSSMLFLVSLSLLTLLFFLTLYPELSFAANTHLPGEDASGKLEAAGTLLRLLDTGLFKWGARLFAGICIMSSAWALKEQRFAIAIIAVVGAIVFGTAPKWVKNIFDISDEQSLFSMSQQVILEIPLIKSVVS